MRFVPIVLTPNPFSPKLNQILVVIYYYPVRKLFSLPGVEVLTVSINICLQSCI